MSPSLQNQCPSLLVEAAAGWLASLPLGSSLRRRGWQHPEPPECRCGDQDRVCYPYFQGLLGKTDVPSCCCLTPPLTFFRRCARVCEHMEHRLAEGRTLTSVWGAGRTDTHLPRAPTQTTHWRCQGSVPGWFFGLVIDPRGGQEKIFSTRFLLAKQLGLGRQSFSTSPQNMGPPRRLVLPPWRSPILWEREGD